MVLMEKRLADLEKRKKIVEKQPADTHQSLFFKKW
jgi:hypothetical protein